MAYMRISLAGLGVAACLVTGTASAAGFYQAKASLSPGIYSNSGSGVLPGGQPFNSDADGTVLGFGFGGLMGKKLSATGPTAILGFDIEALSVDYDSDVKFPNSPANNGSVDLDFDRTDMALTLGLAYNVGVSVTPFLGYRYAFQGDGYFNDDLYIETGYFVGVGVSGMEWIQDWNFSASLAYNDTKLDEDTPNTADVDASGISAQIGARPKQAPFGFSLKYQNFDYDKGALDKEDYLIASVTWYFMQGRM